MVWIEVSYGGNLGIIVPTDNDNPPSVRLMIEHKVVEAEIAKVESLEETTAFKWLVSIPIEKGGSRVCVRFD
jgi:hypothetical protein